MHPSLEDLGRIARNPMGHAHEGLLDNPDKSAVNMCQYVPGYQIHGARLQTATATLAFLSLLTATTSSFTLVAIPCRPCQL